MSTYEICQNKMAYYGCMYESNQLPFINKSYLYLNRIRIFLFFKEYCLCQIGREKKETTLYRV